MVVEGIWGTFLAVTIFSFGLGTLGAGLFTAYFGAGKSRTIGFTLSLVGIVFLLVFAALTWDIVAAVPTVFVSVDVLYGLGGVLGATLGGVLALVLFLAAIMRA